MNTFTVPRQNNAQSILQRFHTGAFHPELLHAEEQEFHGLLHHSGLHLLWKLAVANVRGNNFHVPRLLLCHCCDCASVRSVECFSIALLDISLYGKQIRALSTFMLFQHPKSKENLDTYRQKTVQRSKEIFSKNCQLKGLRNEDIEVYLRACAHSHNKQQHTLKDERCPECLNYWLSYCFSAGKAHFWYHSSYLSLPDIHQHREFS